MSLSWISGLVSCMCFVSVGSRWVPLFIESRDLVMKGIIMLVLVFLAIISWLSKDSRGAAWSTRCLEGDGLFYELLVGAEAEILFYMTLCPWPNRSVSLGTDGLGPSVGGSYSDLELFCLNYVNLVDAIQAS
ncbi:hypothetical protein O6H91_06G146500 [Diphasiastrum complanatum]|uniref:Uncharacterized protein n=1 Tax=Diphasiastrum complanatum TaxID=34168 RepID=A0ACC2DJW7_DIPCM|nr:hypothetical protein O6H91_06G146500 [Diphasiastrum complanatum]